MISYLLVALCVIFNSSGQIFLKLGARGREGSRVYLNWQTAVGYLLMVAVTLSAVLALKWVDLKLLYMVMSLNYVAIALLSGWLLKEKVSRSKALAILLIVSGVIVFNL